MVRYAVVAAAIILAPLSGCIDALLGNEDDAGDITRTIRFDIDEQSIAAAERAGTPAEAFEAVSKTFFTYTHGGDAVATADITARFTTLDGDDVERPLADFTGLSRLSDGDRVTITGAAPYSGLVLDAGETLAQRLGVAADWFTAGGSPLPLAASPGGEARWSLHGEASQAMTFDGLRASSEETFTDHDCGYVETEDGMEYRCEETEVTESYEATVDDASYEYAADMDGEIGLEASGHGAGTQIDLDLAGTFDLSFLLDSLVTFDSRSTEEGPVHEEFRFGVDAVLGAQGDTLLRTKYDGAGEMSAAGGEGSFSTSGSVKMWDMNHSRSAPNELLSSHDLPSESSGYEEESVDLPHDTGGDEVDLLEAIYGMDLAPGDRFQMVVDLAEGDFSVDLDVDVVVAAQERVDVAAGSIDSLRIESSILLDFTTGHGSPQSIEIQDLTHWVHAENYLPVLMEAKASDILSDDRLEQLIRDAAEAAAGFDDDLVIEVPDDLDIQNSAQGRIELTHLQGDVRVPALFSALSIFSPMAVGPAMMFVLVSDLGGPGMHEGYDTAVPSFPNVAVNEADTAGWVQMEHLGGDCISSWDYDFRVQDASVTPWQNVEYTATTDMFCVGDTLYLDAAADGEAVDVTVIDSMAQSMVYRKTIQL